MTGVGQLAGLRSAMMTFEGTRGGTDAHPQSVTHAIASQENAFRGRYLGACRLRRRATRRWI
jgi:hypothetical protein